MAIANVILNDGTVDHTYVPLNIGSNIVSYRDTTNSTLALPQSLEISHQPGDINRPDRHLVKLQYVDEDANDSSIIETAQVHIVVTLPRKVVTPAIAKNLAAQIADFANDSTLMDSLLNGGFPA
jgi:hypothetical protein